MSDLSQKDFDQIEKYILGQMEDTELKEFEQSLETNAELKAELEEQKAMMLAVEAEGLQSELTSIHEELYAVVEKKNSNRPFYLSIAASVAVLVAFSFWYFNTGDSDSELYAEVTYTDPGLPVPMSATDSYDFYDAMVDYKTEDYESAIDKWTVLLEEEPTNDTLNYYIGAAHFNKGAYSEAKDFLAVESIQENDLFKYKAEFMLFLSEIKLGNTERAAAMNPSSGSPFVEDFEKAKESLEL